MKKFFAVTALILGVVVSQIVVPSQASAQRVYVGMNDYGDKRVYILTETIRDITFKGYSGFSVKIAFDDNEPTRSPWYFIRKDGVWCQLMGLSEGNYPTPIEGTSVMKIVETANRYR
ncbi:MAG: hypothetical protein IJ685_11180 [Selenomonadaceae bacterium]|nr:hypothetical protein [Selenomonadaceae bacterium]